MLTAVLLLWSSLWVNAQTNPPAKGMKIEKVGDEIVTVLSNRTLTKGQNVLFVRPRENDDDEVIANGKVAALKDGRTLVKLDLDALKKRPEKTDFVVLLGAPKEFAAKQQPVKKVEQIPEAELPPTPEAGYLQFEYSMANLKLENDSPNRANSMKQVDKMPRSGFKFEWFLDFLSNYGISYSQSSGKVPVKTYYLNVGDATFSQNAFQLMYRTHKEAGFRGTFFFRGLSESFQTDNPDEYVLSTTLNASMLGAALTFEPGELLLTSKKTAARFTLLKFEYATSFSLDAQDGAVSRGSSSGSQLAEMRAIASGTFYLPWMPWVKRWIFSVEAYQRDMKLNFSGATKGEPSGYVIPQEQSYSEKENGVFLVLGWRFEDMIGKVFKPRQ